MTIGIYFLFFCSMLAVSTSPLIALYLDNQVDPISIAFWRMAIGALVLYIYSFTNKKFKPIKILDLGCNNGSFSKIALKNGAKDAVGVDFDYNAITEAYNLTKNDNLNFL